MAGTTEWDSEVIRALSDVAQFDNNRGIFVVCMHALQDCWEWQSFGEDEACFSDLSLHMTL